MNKEELSNHIKDYALSLGFDACGICKADPVDGEDKLHFQDWLTKGYHGSMDYMAKNVEKRLDPTLLVENAKSIVMLALNYYPHEKQKEENPQFAYYAYGKDYHDVVKEKLKTLYSFCQTLDNKIEGRFFCDTAPILERHWAAKAGLGWIGKHSLLIIPQRGSYFFLAALILNVELDNANPADERMPSCVNCTKCIDACPTGAIISPQVIDSKKCLSYQTIENKGAIDLEIIPKMNNRIYGCDICQQVCPWNRFATPHSTKEFCPSLAFMELTSDKIEYFDVESYQQIFKGSAIKRAKLSGLKRNMEALNKGKQ